MIIILLCHNIFERNMDYKLLSFKQKYDFQMQKISLLRKDVNINDKIRLFMYKPKLCNEIEYKFEHYERKKQLNDNDSKCKIDFRMNVKTIGEKNKWNGRIISKFKNKKVKEYEFSQYVHFGKFEFDGDIMIDKLDEHNSIELSGIKKINENEIYKRTCEINENLTIHIELIKNDGRVSGSIVINVGITRDTYEQYINIEPLEDVYCLPSIRFHIIRAMYEIVDKKDNFYLCTHNDGFDYRSDKKLVIPEEVSIKYNKIFQYLTYENKSDDERWKQKIDFIAKPTRDVTDWSGQCLDSKVRELVEAGDCVRCRFGVKHDVETNDVMVDNDESAITINDGVIHINSKAMEEKYSYYFKVLSVDGEYICIELQDCYHQGETEFYNLIDNGYLSQYVMMKIHRDSIFEYPIFWQSVEKQEVLKEYLLNEGYAFTGATVQ